ncbi:MAG: hypothetical protein M3R63_19230 [Actinomycetota bacterium]|nr:hypothetical protein [Actinomycetota bacterium]
MGRLARIADPRRRSSSRASHTSALRWRIPGYAVDDGPFEWEPTKAGDPDIPIRPALLLQAISQRQRWKADYDAAVLLAGDPPDHLSATDDRAA